jgi:hypothetical protein
MKLKLGINCGFAINRYIEPEAWGKFVGELGLHSVQFVADLLNPFLPDDYIESQIKQIKESAKRNDFTIDSIFTSTYTRVNLLCHPDEEGRLIWFNWFKKLFDIGSRLGAKTGGAHFGTMSCDTINNPEKRKRITEAAFESWHKLSYHAKELGYEALIIEPMSIPREFANTVAETQAILDTVNADCGVPLKVNLDIGHAPHPDERDPYPWLLALGKVSPVIHLQQTILGKSMHWPFTPEYNEQGHIKAEKVIACLEQSGCEEALLHFELSHREHWDTDGRVMDDHRASVEYWRKYVKE